MQPYQIHRLLQGSRRAIIHQLLKCYKRQPSHLGLTPEHSTKILFNLYGMVLTHVKFLITQMLLGLISQVPNHRDTDADPGGPSSVSILYRTRDSRTKKKLYPIRKIIQELILEIRS